MSCRRGGTGVGRHALNQSFSPPCCQRLRDGNNELSSVQEFISDPATRGSQRLRRQGKDLSFDVTPFPLILSPITFCSYKQEVMVMKDHSFIEASWSSLFDHLFNNKEKGCDGSILLDDTANFTGEKTAAPNNNSVRGFEVIDSIKSAVECACPGVVSCADILAITARDAVVILGGPSWKVKLGRRDSTTASLSGANNIPPPTSSLSNLISKFSAQGLSTQDMVALVGAHTIGQARCTSFRAHIYNDTDIDSSFASTRQANCPSTSGSGDDNLAPLDLQTPTAFDSKYYANLINRKGLMHSDQELFNNGSTDSQVTNYSNNQTGFFHDFVRGMIKMGDISPLTGSDGEIRSNCRKVN